MPVVRRLRHVLRLQWAALAIVGLTAGPARAQTPEVPPEAPPATAASEAPPAANGPPAPIPPRCPAPTPSSETGPSRGGQGDWAVTPNPVLARRGPPRPQAPPETAADPADAPPAARGGGDIRITSDDATLGVDGNAVLAGNVEIEQGDRRLSADDARYDQASGSLSLQGSIRYEDPLLRARGTRGSYSQSEGAAAFEGAEFELPQRPARGAARSMALDPAGVISLEDVSFTTCPADATDWSLRADRISLDTRQQIGTGRDAQVTFKGVPILYLPYVSFPLGSERKTGFLFPSLGRSTRSGVQLTVPFYWNIAPNLDLTAEPTFYGRRGVDLVNELRYLGERHSGLVAVNFLPNDRVADRDRSRVRWAHRTELPGGWRLRVRGENVSDNGYFEDFATDSQGTSTAFVERVAEISYRDEFLRLRGEVQDFQTLDPLLAAEDRPYTRMPRLLATGRWSLGGLSGLTYGFDGELVNFERNVGVTGWRMDVAPSLGLDVRGPGYFFRPSAGYRYTAYRLSAEPGRADRSPHRSLPFAAVDTGLILERQLGARAQRRMTLEPRLLYLYAPFRSQDELPVFDTAVPDLNFVQLFTTNRFVGADRQTDANQLSVGLTTRMFSNRSQAQFLAASVGQIVYFERPRVLLPGEAPRTARRSDVVAQLELTAYRDFNLSLGTQWDGEKKRRERSQIRLQYRPAPDRVVNLGYRFQRERLEQGEVSAAWPVAQRWSLYSRAVYDMQTSKFIDRFAGLEYRACCWRLRAVARRFVSSSTGAQDTGIYLQLELNGLASVGTAADAFLEGSIRGYSRASASP